MSERLLKQADIGEYQPYHYTAAQAEALIDTNTHGHFLGSIIIGTLGTGLTITISNGPSSTASNIVSKIVPGKADPFVFNCVLDRGCYLTLAGTGFDVTVLAIPMAV